MIFFAVTQLIRYYPNVNFALLKHALIKAWVCS